MATEWKPQPGTEHLFDPLTEWDDTSPFGDEEIPHRRDFETATQIPDGLTFEEIKPGMAVTVSINRRTLDRKYIDRVFHVMVLAGNNILIKEGWNADNAAISHLLTLSEYAIYDATPIMDAIIK